MTAITNVSASIRQRLFNLAQATHRPFQEVLQYYAMERFIDRFSRSPYKDRLVLKGALMFYVWNLSESRATRDIDFLGIMSNNAEQIRGVVADICQYSDGTDGVIFFADSVHCEAIQERNDYSGMRAIFGAEIDGAKVKLQLDIGFGDIVHPAPVEFQYPTLLEMPSPTIKGYTPETLIAEKLHAMLRFGVGNSHVGWVALATHHNGYKLTY